VICLLVAPFLFTSRAKKPIHFSAQFVTLAGVILAFGMDADHGLLTPYIHKRDESKESRN
jgi:hypothetical protein